MPKFKQDTGSLAGQSSRTRDIIPNTEWVFVPAPPDENRHDLAVEGQAGLTDASNGRL
jgi:hypothetical protein